MESLLERTKDADLDQLVRELAARSHGNTRRSLRLKAWKLTVLGAYAVKRIMDILASGIGLGALVQILQKAKSGGGKVILAALQPGPKIVFDITKVSRVFEIVPAVADAKFE